MYTINGWHIAGYSFAAPDCTANADTREDAQHEIDRMILFTNAHRIELYSGGNCIATTYVIN